MILRLLENGHQRSIAMDACKHTLCQKVLVITFEVEVGRFVL